MVDYYKIVQRFVAALNPDTEATRQALYERARAALAKQLCLKTPPAPGDSIRAEFAALEDAIKKVEDRGLEQTIRNQRQKETAGRWTASASGRSEAPLSILFYRHFCWSPASPISFFGCAFPAREHHNRAGAVVGVRVAGCFCLCLRDLSAPVPAAVAAAVDQQKIAAAARWWRNGCECRGRYGPERRAVHDRRFRSARLIFMVGRRLVLDGMCFSADAEPGRRRHSPRLAEQPAAQEGGARGRRQNARK